MADMPESVVTIAGLAEYLKISRSTMYKFAREGRVPGQKVGRHWRFRRQVADSWLGGRPDAEET